MPLYLSQTLAIALFGFRGGWEFIFPGHPDLVVDVVTFVTLMVIARSAPASRSACST